MKKKFFKVIIIILIVIIAFLASYAITYYVDSKNDNKKEANISVLFDDNEYYIMPNNNVLTKEDALKEWPYKFNVKSDGNTDTIYQILIKDDSSNDIKRDSLSYILYLGEKEVKTGKLNDLKNDILYESNIKVNSEQNYKLYVYKDIENDGTIYQYSISLNAIMEGGPGF